MSTNIPYSFKCCITHEIMQDPVVDKEGNTYEKAAIEKWLLTKSTSPITRSPLTLSDLTPNRALKNVIEQFLTGVDPSTKVSTTTDHQYDMSPVEFKCLSNGKKLMVVANNPKGDNRHPVDIVLLLDASGSMSSIATIKNSSGQSENYGLSLLDVVKHGARTIINCLSSSDRVCIISYSDHAIIDYHLNYMNDINKEEALKSLDKICTRGCTNIWGGLERAMNILDSKKIESNQRSVFLLTDGQPNVVPPRGHIPMLKKFMDQHPDCCSINTYGFGYEVDSKLLFELAQQSNGGYFMIPDSNFLGTVFEHSFANLVTTFSSNIKIKIELEGDQSNSCEGFNTYNKDLESSDYFKTFTFGGLQYGQDKHFVFEFKNPLENKKQIVFVEYRDYRTNKIHQVELTNNIVTTPEVDLHLLRSKMWDTITNAMNLAEQDLNVSQEIIKNYLESLNIANSMFPNNYLKALIQDVAGQVTLAFSTREWYQKWGKHYLVAIALAHMNENCTNFKDPGVQYFGGDLFKQIRDMADDVFCNLTPPKPQQVRTTSQTRPMTSMRQMSNSAGPCFAGKSKVLMFDKTLKKCQDIVKGDEILTADGSKGTIRCVVKTPINSGKLPMVELEGGLLVTEWHPIRKNSVWCFPKTVGETRIINCNNIFSFLLEESDTPIMIINSVECVTLAHHIEGEIVGHSYYGTNKIIEDLKRIKGWDKGLVVLKNRIFIRNKDSNLVEKII